jgi:hypothetical protein
MTPSPGTFLRTDRPVRSRPGTRIALAGALAAAAVQLAGCYVLPMDPRTGAPVLPATPAARSADGSYPIVVVPAAPATTVMQARLYPLNDPANRAGMLTAQVADHQSGRGSFSLQYQGQLMQGEATRVDAGFAGFGRIHNEVLGTAGRTYAGRRGIANAYGAQGINAQCEYLITGPAMGTGVCLFSDGAKFQMHF